jgi:transposase InsO family protein
VRYRFINEGKGAYPIKLLCRVMNVSTSAFHAYVSGKSYMLSAAKTVLAKKVEAAFYLHRKRYGSRRITAELAAQGTPVGRFAVRSLMRQKRLQAISARRFVPRTTDSRHTLTPSANLLLDSQNAPHKPREVIVGDITYLPLQSGKWSYLASWQDKFTKRIVGWAVSNRMTDELVTSALEKAIQNRSVKRGTIIHTDQGSQYVSNNFRALLAETGCRQSMSRRGNCYDNATAESFFSRYKAELLEGGMFESVSQARSETFSYIEGYYNRVRRHSALGYKSPEEFEREISITKKGLSSERVISSKT